jgi:hypothetical protein
LWDYENIGEDDRSVNESVEPVDGLEGKVRSDFGAATAIEEVVLAFLLVVLGEVASSYEYLVLYGAEAHIRSFTLPHHPHGCTLDFLACPSLVMPNIV